MSARTKGLKIGERLVRVKDILPLSAMMHRRFEAVEARLRALEPPVQREEVAAMPFPEQPVVVPYAQILPETVPTDSEGAE